MPAGTVDSCAEERSREQDVSECCRDEAKRATRRSRLRRGRAVACEDVGKGVEGVQVDEDVAFVLGLPKRNICDFLIE